MKTIMSSTVTFGLQKDMIVHDFPDFTWSQKRAKTL